MAGDLGKSQLSSLLETVPGLASVLRSPVADAIVNVVRAGAGLREFDIQDAKELVQYATRRCLIPSGEGALLIEEVKEAASKSRAKGKAKKKGTAKKAVAKKKTTKKKATTTKKKTAPKGTKASKAAKPTKKTAKKAAKKVAKKKAAKGKR